MCELSGQKPKFLVGRATLGESITSTSNSFLPLQQHTKQQYNTQNNNTTLKATIQHTKQQYNTQSNNTTHKATIQHTKQQYNTQNNTISTITTNFLLQQQHFDYSNNTTKKNPNNTTPTPTEMVIRSHEPNKTRLFCTQIFYKPFLLLILFLFYFFS